ncbi:hypothetical protein LTR95_000797 [Oleoguttula sp. CCFEE 5521]
MPASFMTLPPELRNDIARLATYHFEANGIIYPRPYGGLDEFMILMKGGHRVSCSDAINAHMGSTSPSYHPMAEDTRQAIIANDNADQHRCTPRCVAQPALTRVCRQLREEILPMFYGMHQFHFELHQFKETRIFDTSDNSAWLRRKGKIIEADAWIYPKTLKADSMTQQMTWTQRAGSSGSGEIKIQMTDRKLRLNCSSAHKQYATRSVSPYFHGLGVNMWLTRAPFVAALQEHGLHVSALECMIASFETAEGCYLSDYDALEVGSEYAEAASEDAAEYTKLHSVLEFKAEQLALGRNEAAPKRAKRSA